MAKLIYVNNMSLDGFIEDENGGINFFPVDPEVFRSHTDLLRSAGTFLYGRGLYEAMAVWETDPSLAAQSDSLAEFANAWQNADKVVYSTALTEPATANTRIESDFDPDAVRELKAAAGGNLTIGGANLAAQALKLGLVDECHLYVMPVSLGRGKPALPTDSRLEFSLVDEHRFSNGVVLLKYRPGGR
ncbi:dihydrofolate reductase family protein [Brevibacterium sp.]|uniref:dihydrofolate reductase family protein n=1 Tax=Brevibacterium sp. TaxID=1701 RepID=UPI00281196F2|nr:dihydrofolate reductase family protein [Brevibacterium sp.]